MDSFYIGVIVVLVIWVSWDVYNSIPHFHPSESLSEDAIIYDIHVKKVGYKNGKHYLTTVYFGDGSTYETHKTKTKTHYFTYEISIDPELRDEIIKDAIAAHNKAYKKQLARR